MKWYKKLGFEYDPFTSETDIAYGLHSHLDELYYFVNSGNMAFIEGPKGSGKSTLLKIFAHLHGGRKGIVYLDCAKIPKTRSIYEVLESKYGVVGRVFKIIPRDMILFADNAKELSVRNFEQIKHLFDNNYLKSAILTGEKMKSSVRSPSLRERIGSRVIKLKALNENESVELVRLRLGKNDIIPEEVIRKLYMASQNTDDFLKKCSKACEVAAKNKSKNVLQEHLETVI